MASVDISIRGAGIFGLSIAWACVERGARIELVDPNGPGAGASGGIVGALAPHVPENWNPKKQFQLESLLMADQFWSNVAHAGGLPSGYARTGRVQPLFGGNAIDAAERRASGATQLWAGHADWSVTKSAGGWDLNADAFVFDTLSAHIHPRMATNALLAALRAKGVAVQSSATATAQNTIWATGVAGLNSLSDSMNREVGRAIKGQAALMRAAKTGAPQVFADGVHIIPHVDGTVAIGSTTERDFDAPDTTDAQLDDVIERARLAVPELADAPVIERWAGLRPRARSRAPMLGQWPERPGHLIANGGFKIGFGMAPKIAEVMANLVLNGTDEIPDGFRIEDCL